MGNTSDDNQNDVMFNDIGGMKYLLLLHLKDSSILYLWLILANSCRMEANLSESMYF